MTHLKSCLEDICQLHSDFTRAARKATAPLGPPPTRRPRLDSSCGFGVSVFFLLLFFWVVTVFGVFLGGFYGFLRFPIV